MTETRNAIIASINSGALVTNYIGHSSRDQYAKEDVRPNAEELARKENSPSWFTDEEIADGPELEVSRDAERKESQ